MYYEIDIHVFGVQSVYCNQELIHFPYKKAEALFFVIAVEKSISRSRAIELLWPDKEESIAKKDLRNAIYIIKKAFGFEMISTTQKSALSFSDAVSVHNDYEEFVDNEKIELYTDTFLHGFFVKDADEFEQWLFEKQELLQKIYLAKMKQLIIECTKKDICELEILVEKYMVQNPLDEDVYYSLMKAYAENGMYYQGIQTYKKLTKVLNEELGISPNHETLNLYHQMSEQWILNSVEEEPQNSDSNFVQQYRGRELQLLHYSYTEHLDGNPCAVLIVGPEDTGKTQLLEQFLNDTKTEDRIMLRAGCFRSEKSFPLQLWSVIISQIGNYVEKNRIELPKVYVDAINLLFPVLGSNVGTAFELSTDLMESSTFQSFRNGLIGLLQHLSKIRPIVIAVSNLQYIDCISLYIFTMLVQIGIPKLFIVATCLDKPEENIEEPMMELESMGLLQKIEVHPLSAKRIKEYLEDLEIEKGITFSTSLKEEICRSRGNPGEIKDIVTQYEKLGKNLNISFSDNLQREKWERLSKSEKNLLNLLSIMEVGMGVEMMSIIYTEEFVNMFDSLYSLRNQEIIEEFTYNNHVYFRFSSIYFKKYVFEKLDDSKKRFFHNRIGLSLEKTIGEELDGNRYKRMIYHFESAGNDGKVIYYRLRSIEDLIVQMYDVYPIHIRSINSLVKPENQIEKMFDDIQGQLFSDKFGQLDYFDEMCARLYYSKACYCISQGIYEEGQALIEKGLSTGYVDESPSYKLNFYRLMAYYGIQTQSLDILYRYVMEGRKLAKENDYTFKMAVFQRIYGLYLITAGKYEESIPILEETIFVLEKEKLNNQTKGINVAASYNYLGEAYRRRKMFSKAEGYYIKALQYCSEKGCPQNATFYMNLATTYLGLGDKDKAFSTFLQADALYDTSLILKGRVITKSYLAVFYAKMGEFEKAMYYLQDAEKFTSYLKSPGENGIFCRILSKLKKHYVNIFDKQFSKSEEEYEKIGKALLQNVKGFYEIDSLYIDFE